MTTKNARDFLDKELFVKRSIVTFRSLSRELGIHVNDAKNELRRYYDAVRDTDAPAVPTYLISGEVPALTVSSCSGTQQSDSTMDMDLEFEEDQGEADVVHQSKVLLVDARALDETMSQFSRISSVHIYSLSPSRFGDAGFVCTPSFKVRNADAKGGLASFSVYGKITGSHVKLKAGVTYQSAASSSRTPLDVATKVPPRVATPTGEQQTTKGKARSSETKEQVPVTTTLAKTESRDRPKLSGKLDWSKAKTKEKEPAADKARDEKKPKPEPQLNVIAKDSDSSARKKMGIEPRKPPISKFESSGVESGDSKKRGIKRKPQINTDIESESEPLPAKAKPSTIVGSSFKKGVIYSDDDDDGEVRMLGQRRAKRKSAMASDSEMSLRAMMDIDDEQVDRVSRVSKVYPQREEEEESEEVSEPEKEATAPPITSEDNESDHVPVIPKKKKPRKVVPVGRNGLKQRRIVKSRTTTDAKGYMQTEDYSSYESVEEEEEAETRPKAKAKGRQTKNVSEPMAEVKPKAVVKEESTAKLKAKPVPKPRGGASKRGGLLNFFGPERGKK